MEIPVKVLVHEEGGRYWAEVPGLRGCVTEGDTREELLRNVREAFEGCFGARQDSALREEEHEPGEVVTL